MGVYDWRKLMGVTTLDIVRAKTFYAEKVGVDVSMVDVPVVGGHAGVTILPLFSQATPAHSLPAETIDALTKRTQDGGTEVVEAKAGKGSATLSMAYAAALFADACLRGLNGQVATECAFVESTVEPGMPFFATRVKLATEGVETVHAVGPVSDYERDGLKAMKGELLAQIEKGIKFAKQ
jgi:malate dehydrogenase